MDIRGQDRVVIEGVWPEIDCGAFAAKRGIGEAMTVDADVFCDGHDAIAPQLLWRYGDTGEWNIVPMKPLGNDRWLGEFNPDRTGTYYYTIEAWIDRFATWQSDLGKKIAARQNVVTDLVIGTALISEAIAHAPEDDSAALRRYCDILNKTKDMTNAGLIAATGELSALMRKWGSRHFAVRYEKELRLEVERGRAVFGAWYELFPRSCASANAGHGTLRDCINKVQEIAAMGFDVLYLPPIHPIGTTHRRGKNNTSNAGEEDPGSPWAIGSAAGGHKAIDPQLGTMDDLEALISALRQHNMEIAIDLALQCSPDHPWVAQHPEWFRHRPDGTIQHAENPPKVYEDIVPLNFETPQWRELWEAIRDVVLYWAKHGVMIFRVDNPHTKPFAFWQWLIAEVKGAHPDALFLSEAFTRPRVMYRLAKVGFSQSYTYFTWRNTKREITEYLTDLTSKPVRDFFRPNFWPNTPDILPEYLQMGGKAAFVIRLILAATLSSNYGIYGPAFELCVNDALAGREEYRDSEKYEIKHWDYNRRGNVREIVELVNRIRRENAALQTTANLRFVKVDNEYMLAYVKVSPDRSNALLIAVNLDPFHAQSGTIELPLDMIDLNDREPYLMYDLLSDDKYLWHGWRNFIAIDPAVIPAHIFRVHRRLKREWDFDYYL